MSVLVVGSSEARAGRSLVAAAIAYRLGRDGGAVTLARLAGDDGAEHDAATFASLDGIVAPTGPVQAADVASISGDVVLEASPGAAQLAAIPGARVIIVAGPQSPAPDVPPGAIAGTIVTRVPAASVATISKRAGVFAVLAEDRVLAAPSVSDIAATLGARHLVETGEPPSIDRVMIGTIASDAAEPYFGARERKCVITRYDKTDVQLAALLTDMQALVLTGGGQPSPYLIDRVRGTRDDVSVLLVDGDTVETMRAIEGLFGTSRFDGAGKLARAVALLDAAGVTIPAAA